MIVAKHLARIFYVVIVEYVIFKINALELFDSIVTLITQDIRYELDIGFEGRVLKYRLWVRFIPTLHD
jgi:hypothetical protein